MRRRHFAVVILGFGLSAWANSALSLDISIVTDANEDLLRSIRGASSILLAERENRTNPADILAAAQADYRWLIQTMYNAGYYGSVISIKIDGHEAALPNPVARAPEIQRVVIDIETGPLFTFSRADMTPRPPGIDRERERLFREGRPAGAAIIDEIAELGVNGWREAGYPKARVADQRIEADHRTSRLSADILLRPGPKATFGTLHLEGESTVKESRIRSIADVPGGLVYDPATVEGIARRMRGTGAFSSVSLSEAETLGPDNSLDLVLETVDAAPHRFGVGGDIDTIDGLSVSAFHLSRNLTDDADSLRISGEATGLAGETGGIDYIAAVRYGRPATFNSETSLRADIEAQRLNEPLYDADIVGATFTLERRFTDTYSASLGTGPRYSRTVDGFGLREFQYIVLPAGVTYDRRNQKLNPRRGTYFNLKMTPFAGVSGVKSALRTTFDGRAYYSFGGLDRLILAGRAQVGTFHGAETSRIPPETLFLSGGGGTVRGQPYQSLLILNDGLASGGKSFLGFSGELRAGVSQNLQLAAFYDAGHVGDTTSFWAYDNTHEGVGLGFRYLTGFAPIRLDIAAPPDRVALNRAQFYVGIGQAF